MSIKCFFFNYAGKENCTKNFQPFSNLFFFYKQMTKIGVEVFSENLPPHFFICLYFIWTGGDGNLKIYLAWPYLPVAGDILTYDT